MQKQAELYRGKAKTVYSTENPDLLVLEFRNDTSAGDGARIEQFDRKGMVNNKFNYFIMSKLAEAGIPTQMERLLSDTECLVKKLDMVPVECVVRNRAAGSLVKRLGIEEGIELNPPLFDLFLKNDAMHDLMHSFMQKENLKKMVIKFTPLLESPYRITLVVPVIKILSPVFIWHPNKFNFCCPELPLAFLNLNGRKAKYLVCRMAMAILLHNSFLFPATYITTSRKY